MKGLLGRQNHEATPAKAEKETVRPDTDNTPKVKVGPERLLLELANAAQPLYEALARLDEDQSWADTHPHKAYPVGKEGLGKTFAFYRFCRSIDFDMLKSLKDQLERIHAQGYTARKVDRR